MPAWSLDPNTFTGASLDCNKLDMILRALTERLQALERLNVDMMGPLRVDWTTGTPVLSFDQGALPTSCDPVEWCDDTPAPFDTDTSDWQPSDRTIQRISSTLAVKLTGIGAPATGDNLAERLLILRNVGTYTITLTHEDAASTAANRFHWASTDDVLLGPGEALWLLYEPTTARWRSGEEQAAAFTGPFAWVDATPAPLSGTYNNWAPSKNTIQRLAASAITVITGMVAYTGVGDELKILQNVGGQPITLTHEDTGSSATNRFHIAGGANILLQPDQRAWCIYDSVSQRWRIEKSGGTPACKGVITYVSNECPILTTKNFGGSVGTLTVQTGTVVEYTTEDICTGTVTRKYCVTNPAGCCPSGSGIETGTCCPGKNIPDNLCMLVNDQDNNLVAVVAAVHGTANGLTGWVASYNGFTYVFQCLSSTPARWELDVFLGASDQETDFSVPIDTHTHPFNFFTCTPLIVHFTSSGGGGFTLVENCTQPSSNGGVPVDTSCCKSVPYQLCATVTATTGTCSCMAGLKFLLTYDLWSHCWVGHSYSASCHADTPRLECVNGTWYLGGFPSLVENAATSASCAPFHLVFSGLSLLADCTGDFTIEVTDDLTVCDSTITDCTVFSIKLGTAHNSGSGTLTKAGVTVSGGTLLVVNVGFLVNTWSVQGVTFNGNPLDQINIRSISPSGGGQLGAAIYAGLIDTETTGDIVFSLTGTGILDLALSAVEVHNLPNEVPDANSTGFAAGSPTPTAPATGELGPTAQACEYVQAVVALPTDGTGLGSTWTNGYATGGQDVLTPGFSLLEGYKILSIIDGEFPALSGTTTAAWVMVASSFE